MLRSVLFIDPPAFCTTVERLVAPVLRARPIAVAAPGADRATVLALSSEARSAGITPGMPVHRARKLCPDLVLLPPNLRLYARASRALHEILSHYAPVIEPKGYGHAFLDLTGTGRLFGPAVDVAARIQREARERIRLPLAVGVAANKLVSQAASTVVKEETDGCTGTQSGGEPALLCVTPGGEPAFLAPHPVEYLPDLDPKTRERLDDYQLDLIGEVAALEERQVSAVFGPAGRRLLAHARGIDASPVLSPERKAEFRAVHTLATDTNDLDILCPLLRRLAERVGGRLRQRHLTARRLFVKLAYTDYATAERGVPLTAVALDLELWNAAQRAFTLANQRTLAIRAVGVTVDRLMDADLQLDMWEENRTEDRTEDRGLRTEKDRTEDWGLRTERGRKESLQHAVDRIRQRWGTRTIGLRA